jgi:transposase-like protein
MSTRKMNLPKLMVDFDTDAECRALLERLRWPNGVRCVRCDSDKISRISTRKQYACGACQHRFSVTAGTVLNDSHLPLPKWFMAVLLMCEAKKSMSANQLMRTLGVAKKTAWYLNHRIREAMAEVNPAPLSGTVEVDETYVGGKLSNHRGQPARRGRPRLSESNKSMVLAAIERGGDIRMRVGKRGTKEILHGFITDTCAPTTANIYTDDYPAYDGIADADTRHDTVKHSVYEYVRGDVHTNTVEGAFSLFKRAIVGSFHQVSKKHLERYLDEFEFRFNNRKNGYLFRDTLTRLVTAKALPYEQLTA